MAVPYNWGVIPSKPSKKKKDEYTKDQVKSEEVEE
jgi:hypothetical protein|tara:strand:+ start:119 stop:223 length:105 start_codon:yes stop_codon:yes gene_type:complete